MLQKFAAVLAAIAVVLGIYIGCTELVNQHKTEVADKAAPVITMDEVEAPAVVNDVEAAEKSSTLASALGFNTTEASEEEKALQKEEGEDVYPDATDSTDAQLSDFALTKISDEMLDKVMSDVSREIDFSSCVTDLEGNFIGRERKMAGKKAGLVSYEISTALDFPYTSDKKDAEGLWKETLEKSRNPIWLSAQIRFDGRRTILKTQYRDIPGNEFFKMFEEEEDKAYADGEGMSHWAENIGTDSEPKWQLTDAYRRYAAMYFLWLQNLSYEGVKNWQTEEKSFLAANAPSNPVLARAEFTDDKDRQTNLPSLVFVPRDKNGKIIGEFFGINYVTRDAERYAAQKSESKKVSKTDPTPAPPPKIKVITQPVAPVASTFTTYTETTTTKKKHSGGGGGKKPDPTPTPPTPTPPTPNIVTPEKNPEDSSQLKPENARNSGKIVTGYDQDKYQPTKPAESPSYVVGESQYQPQSSATQAYVESGVTTPGTENHITAPVGTTTTDTVVAPDGTQTVTTSVVAVNPNAGTVVTNETQTVTAPDGTQSVTYTEQATCNTAPIEVQPQKTEGGKSNGKHNKKIVHGD